jgi:hypothetical protein
MVSIEEESMVPSRLKILLLLAIHVGVGLLLASVARRHMDELSIQFIGLFALVFADAGLIGVWGGLSTTRLAWRLPAVIAAIVYQCAILIRAQHNDSILLLSAGLTTGTILVVLSGLRRSRRKLRITYLVNELSASEGFQFSIRHLLLVTAIVAVVLGIGRGIRNIRFMGSDILFVAIFTPCFITVELATLWAALGNGRPMLRLALVVPTAFIIGIMPIYCLGAPGWFNFIIWPIIMGLQAIFTAASLLVIRSCGWRLVSENGEQRNLPTPP